MASMIPAAGSAALGNAGIRNQGGQAGFLGGPGAIDGSAQSFLNLADPANLTGNASSGHILSNILDPGNVLGQNQAANPLGPNGANAQNGGSGVPSVLPNLGPMSLIPHRPQGAFQPYSSSTDPYNQMAAQSMGGMVFNPAVNPQPQIGPGGKGGVPMMGAPHSGVIGGQNRSGPYISQFANTHLATPLASKMKRNGNNGVGY